VTPVAVALGLAVGLAAALGWWWASDLLAGRRARRRLVVHTRGVRPQAGASARLERLLLRVRSRVLHPGRADRVLPEMLGGVARELRAGATLQAALVSGAEAVDPAADPRGVELALALRRGADLDDALARWAGELPSPARQLASTALSLGAHTGGASALVVDGVADTLRDRLALDREVAALSSQARASAALLVVAPIVVAVLAASADSRIAAFLVGSPVGWACIVGGLVLDLVGAAWMRAIVASAR
jgi:tight adherence protein B